MASFYEWTKNKQVNRGNKETQKWKTTLRKDEQKMVTLKMGEQSLVCGQTNQQDSLQQNCECVCVCMHVQG